MSAEIENPILNDMLMSWIGRKDAPVTATVTEMEVQRFATSVSIERPNPLFLNGKEAKKTPFDGCIAPFFFFGIPFAGMVYVDDLADDGIPTKGGGMMSLRPPIPLPRTMAGGTEVEYLRPIRVGDVLTRQSELVDLTEKVGRSGPLVFTTIKTTYSDQQAKPVVIVRMSTISR